MKRSYFLLNILLITALWFLSACGDKNSTKTLDDNSTNNPDLNKTYLVSAEQVDKVNDIIMLALIKTSVDLNATNAFGYKAIKLTYNTTNQDGEPVIASGLLTIPVPSPIYKAQNPDFTITTLCDNHGTIFKDSEAPSVMEKTNTFPDYSLAVVLTGYKGFAAIMPDYIGYGSSKGKTHPYIMEEGSAQASLDMIKATKEYFDENNISVNGKLYVSGYSEGGYIAISLAKKIEEENYDGFTLSGVAPMAGPYAPQDIATIELNATRTMQYPAFLAYIANSYATFYDLNLSNLLVSSIDPTKVPGLFLGDYSAAEIHKELGLGDGTIDQGFKTHKANELFSEDFINDYQNNLNNEVKIDFTDNAVNNWNPTNKYHLFHCIDDEIIPVSQSEQAYENFLAYGADVTFTPISSSEIALQDQLDQAPQDQSNEFTHVKCGKVAYIKAMQWFDSLTEQ